MEERERRLLDRILASPQFTQALSLRRILQYLCERAGADGSVLPKEYEIAVTVLGRPASFDPKTDPIVRVSIAAVRHRLQAYFESEGRDEPLRLEVPKGLYRAVFSTRRTGEAPQDKSEAQSSAVHRFWQPYLSGNANNLLVYTEVLFFRDDAGNYLRNIYVNNLSGGIEEIRKRVPIDTSHPLKPSFHFVSAGEVHALLSLVRLFARLGIPLAVRNSRFTSWNELRSANLILLGSSRTNSFLDSLQGGSNFVITANEIRNLEPRKGEESQYVGRRYMEGKLEKVIEHAVVTRRPGLSPGTAVTMISANHGRGIEGASNFLTLEADLAGALESSGLNRVQRLPESFQLLLRVHMVDFDEEVINVEYLSHRAARTPGER